MPKFHSKRFVIPSLVALAAGLVLLCACAASIDKDGPSLALGTAATAVKNAGQAVSAVGTATGNPFTTLAGSILSILGGIGVSLAGASKIAASKVQAHDDAPFTPEDAASLDAAKAAAGTPLKPVTQPTA